MTLIKYGIIFVSTGIIISGTLMWNSGDKRNFGESVAEVLAANVERKQYAYAFGTNSFSVVSSNNVVGVRKKFAVLYDVLDDSRDMATDNDGPVYWIDKDITIDDGDVIVDSDAEWVCTTNYDYALSYGSNLVAAFHSTGSRLSNSESFWMPNVSNEISVICDEFFPDSTYKDEHLFDSYDNWWEYLEISTNVYKYSCEEWRNIDGDDISVKFIGGGGFTNVDTLVHIPYPGGSSCIHASSSSSNDNQILSALYKLSADFRNDAYLVFSDAGSAGVTNLNIYFTRNTISAAEGESVTLGIHPASNSGGVESISWSVIGDGVSASYWGQQSLYWGGSNPSWSTTRDITVKGSSDNDNVDAAAVIRFSRSSQPGVYQYIPVWIADDESGKPDMTVSPVLDTMAKGGSASATVAVGPPTNTYVVLDKRMMTNNLVEADKVLESLGRTIVFFPPAALDYDTWMTRQYSSDDSDEVTGSDAVFGTYTFSSALGAYNSKSRLLDSPTTNSLSYDGSILHIGVSLGTDNYKFPHNNEGRSSYSMASSFDLDELKNCTLDYPSKTALESNYVARVRIYLCLSCTLANRSLHSQYDSYDVTSSHNPDYQPWFYESFSYGSGYDAFCSRNDGSTTFPSNGFSSPGYVFSASGFVNYKLAEIVDETAPTDVIKFDIGGNMADYDFDFSAKSDFETFEVEYQNDYNGNYSTQSYGDYDHNNSIKIEKIVVVVDWAWKHCDADEPFEPTINTPGWLQ